MSNEEILKKAIEKAVKNGFNMAEFINGRKSSLIKSELAIGNMDDALWEWREAIIFSHDFAKAFFGECKWRWYADGVWMDDISNEEYEEKLKENNFREGFSEIDGWRVNLRAMVVSENPIKYLKNYMEKHERLHRNRI